MHHDKSDKSFFVTDQNWFLQLLVISDFFRFLVVRAFLQQFIFFDIFWLLDVNGLHRLFIICGLLRLLIFHGFSFGSMSPSASRHPCFCQILIDRILLQFLVVLGFPLDSLCLCLKIYFYMYVITYIKMYIYLHEYLFKTFF